MFEHRMEGPPRRMERMGLIREAGLKDFQELVSLEAVAFPVDRFSDGQIRHTLCRARASTFVWEAEGRIRGSAVMQWRKSSATGHLSSIATHPEVRGMGIGRELLAACEEAALRRGCRKVRLEVREHNTTTIAFYQRHGYAATGSRPGYYADGQAALQMQKDLEALPAREIRVAIPYVPQTRASTSGAACLLMAFKHFAPENDADQSMEMAVWKLAAAHAAVLGQDGCTALGIACAAAASGYGAKALVPPAVPPVFRGGEVAWSARHGGGALALGSGLLVQRIDWAFADVAAALQAGEVPILALDDGGGRGIAEPRWVAATGFDEKALYVHDPFAAFRLGGRAEHIPIDRHALEGARGRQRLRTRSAVFVRKSSQRR